MTAFEKSHEFYDLIYSNKSYDREIQYIETLTNLDKNTIVLDVGCGTGSHLSFLAPKVKKIRGIDLSRQMIEIAQNKFSKTDTVHLEIADGSTFKSSEQLDHIQALFHVVNYFGPGLETFIKNSFDNLRPGGTLIFDFWNYSGVIADPPKINYKSYENECKKLHRITLPKLTRNAKTVEVQFKFFASENQGYVMFDEFHKMHLYPQADVENYLTSAGFTDINFKKWLTHDDLNGHDWFGVCIARKP